MEIICIKSTKVYKINSKNVMNFSWAFFSYSNLIMMKASLKHIVPSGEDVEMYSQFIFLTKWLWKVFAQNINFFQVLLYGSLVHYTVQLIEQGVWSAMFYFSTHLFSFTFCYSINISKRRLNLLKSDKAISKPWVNFIHVWISLSFHIHLVWGFWFFFQWRRREPTNKKPTLICEQRNPNICRFIN